MYRPTMSSSFSTNFGSRETLKLRTRWGFRPLARQCRETLAALGDIGGAEVYEDASIYEASPGTLVALADANRDAERLLLVGHNPGLEQLAALMHSGQTGDYRGMPPGAIAVLALPVDANIEPGIATLTEFWWP